MTSIHHLLLHRQLITSKDILRNNKSNKIRESGTIPSMKVLSILYNFTSVISLNYFSTLKFYN